MKLLNVQRKRKRPAVTGTGKTKQQVQECVSLSQFLKDTGENTRYKKKSLRDK